MKHMIVPMRLTAFYSYFLGRLHKYEWSVKPKCSFTHSLLCHSSRHANEWIFSHDIRQLEEHWEKCSCLSLTALMENNYKQPQ